MSKRALPGRRRLLCLVAGLALAGCSKPRESTPTAEIVTYGVYRLTGAEAPNAAAPSERVVAARAEHERQTAAVRAALKGNFGFEFGVRGLPRQKSFVLELRAQHPPIVGPDGVARTESVSSLPAYTASGHYRNAFIYQFDRPEDLQPGPWILQVRHEGRVLVERGFEVSVGP